MAIGNLKICLVVVNVHVLLLQLILEFLYRKIKYFHEIRHVSAKILKKLQLSKFLHISLGLLIFLYINVHKPLQILDLILIIDDLPVLLLPDHGVKLIYLLFDALLVKIEVLVHFPLRVYQHVADELLNARHH